MTGLARNKIFTATSSNGTDYVIIMKSQPLFFLARICDRYGNPFYNPEVYSYYNIGDMALSSRIKNYGDAHVIALDTDIIWN